MIETKDKKGGYTAWLWYIGLSMPCEGEMLYYFCNITGQDTADYDTALLRVELYQKLTEEVAQKVYKSFV